MRRSSIRLLARTIENDPHFGKGSRDRRGKLIVRGLDLLALLLSDCNRVVVGELRAGSVGTSFVASGFSLRMSDFSCVKNERAGTP